MAEHPVKVLVTFRMADGLSATEVVELSIRNGVPPELIIRPVAVSLARWLWESGAPPPVTMRHRQYRLVAWDTWRGLATYQEESYA